MLENKGKNEFIQRLNYNKTNNEENQNEEDKEYEYLVKQSILQGNSMNLKYIKKDKILKIQEYYLKIIQELQNDISSEKYIELANDCIRKKIKEGRIKNIDTSKYASILKTFYSIKEKIEFNGNNNSNQERVEIRRQYEQLKNILNSILIQELQADIKKFHYDGVRFEDR